MANVNTIKTRILNKYDLLANYSTFKPLKGEICIAEVSTVQNPNVIASGFDKDTYDTRPIVGIKVGDGEHTFADLPWIQAVAGDVTAWCKTNMADFDSFKVQVAAAVATSEGELQAAIIGLDKRIDDLEATVNTGDNSNEKLRTAISAVESTVGGHTTELGQLATNKAEKTQVATDIATAKTAVLGQKDGADFNGTVMGAYDAAASAGAAAKAANDAIGSAPYTGDTLTAAIAALQSSIGDSSEGLGTQVSALKEVVGDASSGLVKDVADLKQADTDMSARVKANEDKLTGINDTVAASIASVNTTATEALTKVKTLIGSDSSKSVREIAIAVLTEKLIAENANEARDTLEEIAAWIQSHPNDAAAMNNAIKAVKQNLGYTTNEEGTEVVPATVDSRIATAISNLETKINISNYVDKATYKTTTDAVAALTAKVDTGDKNVSVYVTEALATYANSGALHEVSERVKAIEDAPYASTGYVDGKVAALAGEGNTSTVKANADAIAALAGTNNTSTVSGNATNIASLTATVKGLVKNDTVEGIVSAVTQNSDSGEISVTHKKITMEDMAQKDPTNSAKDYIFIFDCGNASRDAEQSTEQDA